MKLEKSAKKTWRTENMDFGFLLVTDDLWKIVTYAKNWAKNLKKSFNCNFFFQFLEHTVHFANRWEHYRARVKLNSVVEKKHVQLRLLSIHLDEKQVTAKLKSIVKLGNTKYNNGSTKGKSAHSRLESSQTIIFYSLFIVHSFLEKWFQNHLLRYHKLHMLNSK